MTNEELQAKYVGKWFKCIDKSHGEVDKWYRIENVRRNCDYCVEAYINSHWIGWREDELVSHHFDCDNLMDYNPDQIHDVTERIEPQEFEEINEDNIDKVLIHNNMHHKIDGNAILLTWETGGDWDVILDKRLDNMVEIIEAYFGRKLKPIPRFDFEQYLIDNGFRNQASEYDFVSYGVAITLNSSGFKFKDQNNYYSQNKENADILIEMSELAEKMSKIFSRIKIQQKIIDNQNEQIAKLKDEIVQLKLKDMSSTDKYYDLRDKYEAMRNMSLFARIFKWKK